MNFFGDVLNKRYDTELTLQGIKRRRQDPLPDIPGQNIPHDRIPNGNITSDGTYASIAPGSVIPPDSPYVEVALRHSYIMHIDSGDSTPSSPDRRRSRALGDRDDRSISTTDNDDDVTCIVEHDVTGLYAKIDKRQNYTYIKKVEKPSSDEDDDDILWQDNMAYDSTNNMNPPECVSVASNLNLDSPKISDRPYATVPFLPKGHKSMVRDYDKFATMPESKKGGWYSNEPTYASIDQLKSEIIVAGEGGYEPDNTSSVSSKSKESTGSQTELHDLKPSLIPVKSPVASPGVVKPLWHLQGNWDGKEKPKEVSKKVAPLASLDVCIYYENSKTF